MSSHHFLILDLITAKVLLGGWRRENANIRTVAWVGDLALYGEQFLSKKREFEVLRMIHMSPKWSNIHSANKGCFHST